ncbi:hypothetical protein INR49_004419 [Caranx melampygus]|nr:hypothetical protein INR49_004419 [Caranx melampygus]
MASSLVKAGLHHRTLCEEPQNSKTEAGGFCLLDSSGGGLEATVASHDTRSCGSATAGGLAARHSPRRKQRLRSRGPQMIR